MLRVDTVLQIPRWRSPHEGLLLTISLKRYPSLLRLSVLSFPWLLRMCPSGHVMFLLDDVPVRTYTLTVVFLVDLEEYDHECCLVVLDEDDEALIKVT
ncbi:hypothetical protein Tco_0076046, partial [Tanacetum coccineum]